MPRNNQNSRFTIHIDNTQNKDKMEDNKKSRQAKHRIRIKEKQSEKSAYNSQTNVKLISNQKSRQSVLRIKIQCDIIRKDGGQNSE